MADDSFDIGELICTVIIVFHSYDTEETRQSSTPLSSSKQICNSNVPLRAENVLPLDSTSELSQQDDGFGGTYNS